MNALPPPGTRVVIYARYSTDMQSFKSIEDQIALCRAFAERHGWIVVEVYFDAERSGTTTAGRSGFFSMMAAADRGEFTVLLAEDLDRLSRNAADTHGMVEDLESLDVDICTVMNGMVSDLEVAFAAVKNQQFIKGLAQKTRRGQEGTVKSGRISGSVAYGYDKVFSPDGQNGLRKINDAEADVVRRIFKDYVAGVSTLDICRALNAEGVPAPKSKAWRPGALTGTRGISVGILRNKLYIGEFHWGRTRRKRSRKKRSPTIKAAPVSERIVAKVPHLRIIDDDLFEAAQARLEERSTERRDHPLYTARNFNEYRHPDYLFSRKITCGLCGSRMVLMNGRVGCTGRAVKGLKCDNSRRVPRADLEEAVLGGLKNQLLRPDLIEPCLAEYRAELERSLAEQKQKTEFGQTRLKDLERDIANVLAQVRSGQAQGLAGQVLMADLERLEAERQRLEKDVGRKLPVLPDLSPEAMVERLTALVEDLRGALSGPERNAVSARDRLRSMIDKIVVTPLPMEKTDGRGAGPVRLVIEGSLTQMLDLAEAHAGRVTLHASCPRFVLGSGTLTFRFWVDLRGQDSRLVGEGYADIATIARLLDKGDVPVTRQRMLFALSGGVLPEDPEDRARLELRWRSTVDYLRHHKLAHGIMMGAEKSGYVWSHYPFTDEQWKARANMVAHHGHYPLPVIRFRGPEARVVVIGAKAVGATGADN